jgi:hypothetical protein
MGSFIIISCHFSIKKIYTAGCHALLYMAVADAISCVLNSHTITPAPRYLGLADPSFNTNMSARRRRVVPKKAAVISASQLLASLRQRWVAPPCAAAAITEITSVSAEGRK